MKVFVPFFEGVLGETADEGDGLGDAELVPFSLDYPVLRIAAARSDDPLPEAGEAQIIPAEAFKAHRRS